EVNEQVDAAMAIQDGQHDRRNRGTLSSWLRGALTSFNCGAEDRCDSRDDPAVATLSPRSTSRLGPAPGEACAAAEGWDSDPAATSGVLVPFPIHGEALLVKLADALRKRAADICSERDPLLLKMSRRPGSRLAIDQTAYVQ